MYAWELNKGLKGRAELHGDGLEDGREVDGHVGEAYDA